jgi:DNA mismatch repair ATPase MutS
LNTITKENDKLLTQQRKKSIEKISQMVDSMDLQEASETVQSVLSEIPAMKSVAEIIMAENDAINDIVKIKDILSQCTTIRLADLLTKPYLETKNDVNEFLNRLKNKMKIAIDNNERIKIQ